MGERTGQIWIWLTDRVTFSVWVDIKSSRRHPLAAQPWQRENPERSITGPLDPEECHFSAEDASAVISFIGLIRSIIGNTSSLLVVYTIGFSSILIAG